MYETFYKLNGRPFHAAPVIARYFAAQSIDSARQTLTRCIERGEGVGLIVGPSGTGKSLLCQLLAAEFSSRFATALLASGRLGTRTALLQAVLYELGLPYRGLDEGELRLALMDFLEPAHADHAGLLLVIDEAHALPWRVLDEVRSLTNFVRDGQARVRVVLAGSEQLEEHLSHPRMASFQQRLAARCYLEPLSKAETASYVRAQLAAAGCDNPHLFDGGALEAVHQYSEGLPRFINQVCDHALLLASLGGVRRIERAGVEEAWADLQQLPAPWGKQEQAATSGADVVEFGGLDDDAEDFSSPIPIRHEAPQPLRVAETGLDSPSPIVTIKPERRELILGRTEIDLDFPEFGDPFTEKFAEEEVVLDRHENEAEIFAKAPRVQSWEGAQLGSRLSSWEISVPLTEVKGDINITFAGVAPSDAVTRHVVPPAAPPPEPAITSYAPKRSPWTPEIAIGPDPIVVLDDDLLAPATSGPTSASGKKPAFRQLFSKMRRG